MSWEFSSFVPQSIETKPTPKVVLLQVRALLNQRFLRLGRFLKNPLCQKRKKSNFKIED
jgi:hypothetical protein